jgi:hypothetical protein
MKSPRWKPGASLHQFYTNAALRLGGVFVLIFGHVPFKDVFHGAVSRVAHRGDEVRVGVVTDPVCPGSLTLTNGFARALPRRQTPVDLQVLEDMALLLAFLRPMCAPEKGSTLLLLGSDIFARFYSRLIESISRSSLLGRGGRGVRGRGGCPSS